MECSLPGNAEPRLVLSPALENASSPPLLLPGSNRHDHAVCEVAVQAPIAVAEGPAPLAACCGVHLVPEGLFVVIAKIDWVPDAAGFRDSPFADSSFQNATSRSRDSAFAERNPQPDGQPQAPPPPPARVPRQRARHEPQKTVLYQVVRAHLLGFLQSIEEDGSRSPLPRFVIRELRAFRECGLF